MHDEQNPSWKKVHATILQQRASGLILDTSITPTANQLCQSTLCEKAHEGHTVRFCQNRTQPRRLCENINFKEVHFPPIVRHVERVIRSNGIRGAALLRRLLVAQFPPCYCTVTCSNYLRLFHMHMMHAGLFGTE